LEDGAVEVTVLLAEGVIEGHTKEGLGGLDEGDVRVDFVLVLAGLGRGEGGREGGEFDLI